MMEQRETVKMCRICFRAAGSLYSMVACQNLHQAYGVLTGLCMDSDDNLPPYLCSLCAQKLLNCFQFRTRSLQAHLVLLQVVRKYGCLTPKSMTSAMGTQNFSHSNLVVKYQTDHYDLEIKHLEKDNVVNVSADASISSLKVNYIVDDIKTEEIDTRHEDSVDMMKENNVIKDIEVENNVIKDIKVENNNYQDWDKKIDNIQIPTSIIEETNAVDIVKIEKDCSLNRFEKTDLDRVDNIERDGVVRDSVYEVSDIEGISVLTFEDDNDIKQEDVFDEKEMDIHNETCLSSFDDAEWRIERDKSVNSAVLDKDSVDDKVASDNVKGKDPSEDSTSRMEKSKDQKTIEFGSNHLLTNVAKCQESKSVMNNKLSCDICHYQTVHEVQLLCHLKAHAAAKCFNCKLCKYKTKNRNHLNTHTKTHLREKPYSCAYCAKAFCRRSTLLRHLRAHAGDKPYSCDICEKRFTENGSLRNHLIIHSGEKPYSCQVCSKEFNDKSSLRRHLRLHTGDKRHSCDVCKKTFYDSDSLKKHAAVHTDVRKYSCDICLKSFKDKRAVKKHLTIHFNVSHDDKQNLRPFSCEECGKKFSQKGLLTNHLPTHSDEKPYSCDVCLKAFTYRVGLRKHMKVHSIRDEYSCEFCNKLFREKNYLKKHMRLYCRVKLNR